MKPEKGQISNWEIVPTNPAYRHKYEPNLGFIIHGVIHGHPDRYEFPNGGAIITSLVVSITKDGSNWIVETLNSRYALIHGEEVLNTEAEV